MGYIADERFCVEIADSGRIPVSRDDENHQQWQALDVAKLILELEVRRRWQPSHPAHLHKLNWAERLQIDAERCGAPTFVADLGDFDVEALLVLMVESELRPIRDLLRVAIVTKLAQQGAL